MGDAFSDDDPLVPHCSAAVVQDLKTRLDGVKCPASGWQRGVERSAYGLLRTAREPQGASQRDPGNRPGGERGVRAQLKQRIDQAQVDANLALKDAKQQADQAAEVAESKWAQMKADAAAKMDDVKTKIDKRADQRDAKVAATDADWAELEASDAIDYAAWAVYSAKLAVLDALDARVYAADLAKTAGS